MSRALKKSYKIHPETCGQLCEVIERILDDEFDAFMTSKMEISELHEKLRSELESEIPRIVTIPMRKSFVEHIKKDIENAG